MRMNNKQFFHKALVLALIWLGGAWVPSSAQAPKQDTFIVSGAKLAYPDSPRYPVKDGRVFSGEALSVATGVALQIPISHCVTYKNPYDPFPSVLGGPAQNFLERAIADGLVSKEVKFTLFIFLEKLPGSPEDGKVNLDEIRLLPAGSANMVKLFSLNGANKSSFPAPLATGIPKEDKDLSKWSVISFTRNSKDVQFGNPLYSPETHVDTLYLANRNLKKISPEPGANHVILKLSSYSESSKKPVNYRVHLSGMIEFGAVAPIIFIHGTAASSTSWEEPWLDSTQTSSIEGPGHDLHVLENFRLVSPKQFSSKGFPVRYAGPWFYKIDLGSSKLLAGEPDSRKGQDRYINELYKKEDGKGNASNKYSGKQLRMLIPLVLEMYGMNGDTKWADAAHSKGGSDSRWLITKILPERKEQELTLKPFKVSSFYTLGTPFRGTPVSDLAYTLGWGNATASVINAGAAPTVHSAIRAATLAVGIANDVFASPKGAALRDQRYKLETESAGILSRNIEDKDWSHFLANKGRYFSVAGDADINGDRRIDAEEAKVLNNPIVNGILGGRVFNGVYQLLATAQDNIRLKLVPGSALDRRAYLVVEAGTPFETWMPNDLVTPFTSAMPKELEGKPWALRVAYRAPFFNWFATQRHDRGGDIPDVDVGNHSMLKNSAVIDRIVANIKNNYPTLPPPPLY